MLSRIRRSMADRDQGFTLIELLVVIIIIGILAAIAIPVFLNQRKKGVDASLKSDLHNAAVIVEAWAGEHPGRVEAVTGTTYEWATPPGSNGGVMSGLKVSAGNKLLLMPSNTTDGGWCVRATNPNASKATSAYYTFIYRSLGGGLDTTVAYTSDLAACP